MDLDNRLREGLRSPNVTNLDVDHALHDVVARARVRRRHRRITTVGALAIVVVIVTVSVVVLARSGDNARLATQVTQPHGPVVNFPSGTQLASVEVPRAAAASTDVDALVHDNTAFAFDLYAHLARGDAGNLVFSPFSLSTVLAMTWAGAKGNTADEIAHALHFTLPPQSLHAAFNALDQQLTSPRHGPAGSGDPLRLDLDNSVWSQAGYPIVEAYLDTLAADYGAPVHLADYAQDPEAARTAINAYVAAHTNDKIRDLLSPDVIDALTRLVLVNTVAFKASWQVPFTPAGSVPFKRLDGSTTRPDMMTSESTGILVHSDTYDSIRIPYVGGASMRLIVPAEGHFDEVQRDLDVGLLDQIRSAHAAQTVDVMMPKFGFASTLDLKDPLETLGMHDAFVPPTGTSGADLTGITPARELFVSAVVQQATIDVDERGTEATAASAVGVTATAGHPEFTVDRPFIFVIEDDATGTVLFAGRVTQP